jgi:hypothetical protein
MMPKQRWALSLWLGASMLLIPAYGERGTSSAADGEAVGFVGAVEGTDAFIAIVAGDGEEEIAGYFWEPMDDPDAFSPRGLRLANDHRLRREVEKGGGG